MNTKPRSAITRINEQLKRLGWSHKLVKGRGYYYLMSTDEGATYLPATAIYMNRIGPKDYNVAAASVEELFAAVGITINLERD